MRQRFLPVAAAFWQGVPARVRAKHRGAWRKGNGSRVTRSTGLISSFIVYPSLRPFDGSGGHRFDVDRIPSPHNPPPYGSAGGGYTR
jgi:hypothetical protein